MKIDLIAVGKKMPMWVEAGLREYLKRLPKNIHFKLIEINPAIRSKSHNIDHYKQQEAENILAAIPENNVVIVFDEKGKHLSSLSFANKLQTWHDDNQHVSLIIGGADGLSERIKNKARELWSLSEMTLPHGLVRVMVVEQIYRAWSINQNHPYHRE